MTPLPLSVNASSTTLEFLHAQKHASETIRQRLTSNGEERVTLYILAGYVAAIVVSANIDVVIVCFC